MDLYEQADEFRRRLAEREARTLRTLAATWRATGERIQRRVDQLADQVAAAGSRVPVSWLFQHGRLAGLAADIRTETARWMTSDGAPAVRAAVDAEATIGPVEAMELVASHVRGFPAAAAASLVRLRPDEVAQITATLQPGAPLERLLDRVAGEHADRAAQALVDGVAANRDPRLIARDIAPVVQGGLSRTMTITRTELLRTSREGRRQAWLAKRDVVAGWRWWSSLDRTTCPVCWAMHGTLHQLEEPFGTHPQCRCSMIPELRPAAELGFPVDDLEPPTPGVDVFAGLTAAQQRRVLGPGKFQAYHDGRLTLPDLVAYRRDPVWGPTRSEAPLRNVITPGRSTTPAPATPPPPTATPTQAPAAAPKLVHPADVADVFTAAKRSTRLDVHGKVTAALDTLGDLIRLPDVAPVPVRYGRPASGAIAHYRSRVGTPVEIMMGPKHPDIAAGTFLHEFGHYIDAALLDPGSGHVSKRAGGDTILNDWRDAIRGTDAVKTIASDRTLDPGFRRYLLSLNELFARSFAQWAALRSGDTALLAEVRYDLYGGVTHQWDDADFAAVADAFDTLFDRKGWWLL